MQPDTMDRHRSNPDATPKKGEQLSTVLPWRRTRYDSRLAPSGVEAPEPPTGASFFLTATSQGENRLSTGHRRTVTDLQVIVSQRADRHRVISPFGTAEQNGMSDVFGGNPVVAVCDAICQIAESPVPPGI